MGELNNGRIYQAKDVSDNYIEECRKVEIKIRKALYNIYDEEDSVVFMSSIVIAFAHLITDVLKEEHLNTGVNCIIAGIIKNIENIKGVKLSIILPDLP